MCIVSIKTSCEYHWCNGFIYNKNIAEKETYLLIRHSLPWFYILEKKYSLSKQLVVRPSSMECTFLWVDSDNSDTGPFYAIISVLAICISLPGNTLTALVIFTKPELRNEPTYLLICSVCFADVLVASVVQPLFICTMLLGTRRHCYLDNAYYVFAWVSAVASALGVLPITLERYIYILHPLRYNLYITKRRAQLAITLSWLIALSIGLLPLFWYDSVLNHSMSLFIVLLVSSSMFYSYARIYLQARRSIAPVQIIRAATAKKSRKRRIQGQATRTVFFILISFFACWFPYVLVSFLIAVHNYRSNNINNNGGGGLRQNHYERDSLAMHFYWGTLLLGYCNSSVNVFIYGRKNSVLRRAVGNYLRKLFNINNNNTDFAQSLRRRDSVKAPTTLPTGKRCNGGDLNDQDSKPKTIDLAILAGSS